MYPNESYGYKNHLLLGFIRISNFLNFKKDELNDSIKEDFLDLRFEGLPQFTPKNLRKYRRKLRKLLKRYYKKFSFDCIGISCYTSFCYMNCVEVISLIRKKIAPKCLIVVGGPHASVCPEDFQIGNFPEFIYKKYSKKISPFDYLIKDEAELTFFKLIKGIIDKTAKQRESLSDPCVIIEPEILKNLNELPIIDFKLFKKYKHIINQNKMFSYFSLDFSRGCPFQCRFCYNSGNLLNSCKRVRVKSIAKSMKELEVIKNTKWLNINELFITDMIFLPKRSKRDLFFKEMNALAENKEFFPFKILTMNRIELCRNSDLENYKKFNIIPHFGLESCSKTLLYRMGKILGKNDEEIMKGIDNHLSKFVEIAKYSNQLDLPVIFFYIIGLPGSDRETFKEGKDFLFKPRTNGKSLIENYKINFLYNKYVIYKNTEFYDCCEEKFNSKIHYKEWWKEFDEYYQYYPALVDPSVEFPLINSLRKNLHLFKRIFRIQQKIGNNYYESQKIDGSFDNSAIVINLLRKSMNKLGQVSS